MDEEIRQRLEALESRVGYYHLESMALSYALRDWVVETSTAMGRSGEQELERLRRSFARHLQDFLESIENGNPDAAAKIARHRPQGGLWDPTGE